jgi:hypothetical protein
VEPDESPDIAAKECFFQRSVAPVSDRPKSSSSSRFTAAQATEAMAISLRFFVRHKILDARQTCMYAYVGAFNET